MTFITETYVHETYIVIKHFTHKFVCKQVLSFTIKGIFFKLQPHPTSFFQTYGNISAKSWVTLGFMYEVAYTQCV